MLQTYEFPGIDRRGIDIQHMMGIWTRFQYGWRLAGQPFLGAEVKEGNYRAGAKEVPCELESPFPALRLEVTKLTTNRGLNGCAFRPLADSPSGSKNADSFAGKSQAAALGHLLPHMGKDS